MLQHNHKRIEKQSSNGCKPTQVSRVSTNTYIPTLTSKQSETENEMSLEDIREFLIPCQELTTENLNNQQYLEQLVLKQQFLIDNNYLKPQDLFGGMNSHRLEDIFNNKSINRQQSLDQFKAPSQSQNNNNNVQLIKSTDFQSILSNINQNVNNSNTFKRMNNSKQQPKQQQSNVYNKIANKKEIPNNNYFKQSIDESKYNSNPISKPIQNSIDEYKVKKQPKISYKSYDFTKKSLNRMGSPQQSLERQKLDSSASQFSNHYQSIKSIAKKIEQSTSEQQNQLNKQIQVTSQQHMIQEFNYKQPKRNKPQGGMIKQQQNYKTQQQQGTVFPNHAYTNQSSTFTQLHIIQNKIQQFKNNLQQMDKKNPKKKNNNVFTSMLNNQKKQTTSHLKLKENDLNIGQQALSNNTHKFASPKFSQNQKTGIQYKQGLSRQKSPEIVKQKDNLNLFSFISPKGQKENTSIFNERRQMNKGSYLSAKTNQFQGISSQLKNNYQRHY